MDNRIEHVEKSRLLFIDNVRLLVIVLVVVMHLAVTYSGFGSWYYKEGAEIGTLQTIAFGYPQAFVQGFSMGLMFLIAGYFVPESYDRKGFARFVRDRLVRLGLPVLTYMLLIHPLTAFGLLGYRLAEGGLLATYARYLTSLSFLGESGPLWFALALLFFTLAYALLRRLFAREASLRSRALPSFSMVLALVIVTSLATFLVRIVQPIGTSIMNVQLCYFPQYVVFFILGICCKRNDWLMQLGYKVSRLCLVWGLSLGCVAFLALFTLGGALSGDLSPFEGGLTWQSAAFAVWESCVAVSMSVGLLAFYKEKHDRQGRLVGAMSRNAFAVYVFHPPIIVALTLLLAPIGFIPIIKFLIAVAIGVPACFLATNFTVHKVPVLSRLFA
ncbi:MAG: acyltransferase family protein [Coriobacteriia bacterium]|nr:acyltransferase family protein [Coriobacteriia bacterium]